MSAAPAPPDVGADGGEFYIGWAPTPPGHRRFLRAVVLGLCLLICGVGATILTGLRPAPRATFEYGKPRLWRGRVALEPAPLLWADDGSALYLVAPGKHGAGEMLAGLDGARVALEATLIERAGLLGPQRMLEVERVEKVAALGVDPPAPPAARALGRVRWRGEIADGKCYLGVMVPGEGKTHRDCAARCLSGGTPPMLALADGRGGSVAVLLAAPGAEQLGEPLGARLARFAGEPVWVSGELAAYGDLMVLSLDATGVTRADE